MRRGRAASRPSRLHNESLHCSPQVYIYHLYSSARLWTWMNVLIPWATTCMPRNVWNCSYITVIKTRVNESVLLLYHSTVRHKAVGYIVYCSEINPKCWWFIVSFYWIDFILWNWCLYMLHEWIWKVVLFVCVFFESVKFNKFMQYLAIQCSISRLPRAARTENASYSTRTEPNLISQRICILCFCT